MNFHVLTLFPEMIENGMNTSITGRWEGRCRGCAGRGHDSAAVLVPVLDRTGDHPFCWLEKQGISGTLSVHGTGSAGLYSGA